MVQFIKDNFFREVIFEIFIDLIKYFLVFCYVYYFVLRIELLVFLDNYM